MAGPFAATNDSSSGGEPSTSSTVSSGSRKANYFPRCRGARKVDPAGHRQTSTRGDGSALVIGTLMLVAGLAILGRVAVGPRIAGVPRRERQPHLPARVPRALSRSGSFTMILVDMLVIYGLVVHGGVVDDVDLDLSE